MVIIFKEDWSEVPSLLLHAGEKTHLHIMKEKDKYKDQERGIPKRGISFQSALQLTPKS